jgi:hypothetical protein
VSRIPPPLARRLDRLSRRAHTFHRWSHHPLCDRYAGEVVRLGRRSRVCLGCTLTALGAVAGAAAGAILPPAPGPLLLAAGAVLLAMVPRAIRFRTSDRPDPDGGAARRVRKLLTRFLPTAVAGVAAAQAAAGPSSARLAGAALAAAALGWGVLRYRRRGPDRSACLACPQAPPGTCCAGFAPVARRERAMSRLAGRWIARASGLPAGAPAGVRE